MTDIFTNHGFFVLQPGENLLNALEQNGYEVNYQCRRGWCGSCRLKMRAGAVRYDQEPLACLGRDEILPCCCRPLKTLSLDVSLRSEQRDLFVPELFDDNAGNAP